MVRCSERVDDMYASERSKAAIKVTDAECPLHSDRVSWARAFVALGGSLLAGGYGIGALYGLVFLSVCRICQ